MPTEAMFNGFFISDITRAKLYVQFFRPKKPKSKYRCRKVIFQQKILKPFNKLKVSVSSGLSGCSKTNVNYH